VDGSGRALGGAGGVGDAREDGCEVVSDGGHSAVWVLGPMLDVDYTDWHCWER
jgi:hypothetical protein